MSIKFMDQSPNFEVTRHENKSYKLSKA